MAILSNGLQLPDFCYGSGIVLTYRYGSCTKTNAAKYWIRNLVKDHKQLKKDMATPKILNYAMEQGCNMFDTSRAYGGGEYLLGKVLKKYKREDKFIVTKLCNQDQYSGKIYDAFMSSLSELKTDYVDLYLMHWPVSDKYINSWIQMEQLYERGFCKAIGVCNFNIHHLETLKKYANVFPMVNQFECHPLFTQRELRTYCKSNKIQVMAYTSTARMDERLQKTILTSIAHKYKKTIAQVILKWHQQIGNIPIVNSFDKKHIIENMNIYDFQLEKREIDAIEQININSRLRYDPDNCDFTKL